MKLVYKWLIWLGCALLVISITFNVILVRGNLKHKLNMRIALSNGIMAYSTANKDLKNGNIRKSTRDAGFGIANLNTAANNLPKQHGNITKLNTFLQLSLFNQVAKRYSSKRIAQDNHIFDIVSKAFQSLISHPKTINNNELNKDFQKVFNAMTPQQKQTMNK